MAADEVDAREAPRAGADADAARGSRDFRPRPGPRAAEENIQIPARGALRYNHRGFFRAVCRHPRHGNECQRQRQSDAGHWTGSGRPIGALLAWLEDADAYPSAEEHIASKTREFEKRLQARRRFAELPGADIFLNWERRPSERDGHAEEPRRFR